MKRRSFLKRGLAGGLLLALGGASALALFPARHVASPARPLRVLSDRAFQVMVAVARRIITDPKADHAAIALGVDDLATRMQPEVQRDLVRLLLLFESGLGRLLLDGSLVPFTRLGDAEQDLVLDRWRKSTRLVQRTGFRGLKNLCVLAHYTRPESWHAVGFPPPTPVGSPYDDSKFGTPEWLKERGLEDIP